MCPPSKDTPTKSGSAEPVPPVTWTLPHELGEIGAGSLKAKCTVCKIPTEFHWTKLTPFNVTGTADPMESLKLTKRLKVCTNCGTYSLTN